MTRCLVALLVVLNFLGDAFGDEPSKVVFVIGDDEYETAETLPKFAEAKLKPAGVASRFVVATPEKPHDFPGMEDLSDARTIVVSARRRAPTKEQLAGLKTAIDRGVGVVAVRTACHAFSLAPRGNPQPDPPAGHAVWPDIDRELLGCDYRLHWNNKADDEPRTLLKVVSADDPLLAKWPREPAERPTRSWLYKARPLTDDCKLLISGRVPGRTADGEDEPVAWTRVRGKQRIFATTLGHPEELADEVFAELLRRGVMWTLGE